MCTLHCDEFLKTFSDISYELSIDLIKEKTEVSARIQNDAVSFIHVEPIH